MELVRGRTLDEVVPTGGLQPGRFLDLAVPLADAVAVAHDRGVVHRDTSSGHSGSSFAWD